MKNRKSLRICSGVVYFFGSFPQAENVTDLQLPLRSVPRYSDLLMVPAVRESIRGV